MLRGLVRDVKYLQRPRYGRLTGGAIASKRSVHPSEQAFSQRSHALFIATSPDCTAKNSRGVSSSASSSSIATKRENIQKARRMMFSFQSAYIFSSSTISTSSSPLRRIRRRRRLRRRREQRRLATEPTVNQERPHASRSPQEVRTFSERFLQ